MLRTKLVHFPDKAKEIARKVWRIRGNGVFLQADRKIFCTMTERMIEDRMIFAASCVESAARELNISAREMYQRMKRVNLVDGYILKHYDAIHSESRKHITEDIVGCLLDWEKSKLGKEVAQ